MGVGVGISGSASIMSRMDTVLVRELEGEEGTEREDEEMKVEEASSAGMDTMAADDTELPLRLPSAVASEVLALTMSLLLLLSLSLLLLLLFAMTSCEYSEASTDEGCCPVDEDAAGASASASEAAEAADEEGDVDDGTVCVVRPPAPAAGDWDLARSSLNSTCLREFLIFSARASCAILSSTRRSSLSRRICSTTSSFSRLARSQSARRLLMGTMPVTK